MTRSFVYVVTWPGKRGPCCRKFTSASVFDGYVRGLRAMGYPVTFTGPQVAQTAI